jgi:hypothetical protein
MLENIYPTHKGCVFENSFSMALGLLVCSEFLWPLSEVLRSIGEEGSLSLCGKRQAIPFVARLAHFTKSFAIFTFQAF